MNAPATTIFTPTVFFPENLIGVPFASWDEASSYEEFRDFLGDVEGTAPAVTIERTYRYTDGNEHSELLVLSFYSLEDAITFLEGQVQMPEVPHRFVTQEEFREVATEVVLYTV
jgi:hypothetical protein